MKLTLTLTGDGPMLQHNGRLSNPLDPYTRAIKAISKKRNKTDEDLAEMAQLEARGCMYETDDGFLGLPNENVWRCVYDASKAFKLGEDIKRGLNFIPQTMPLVIDGEQAKCDTYLHDPEHMFYKSVKVMRARVMRSRPIIRNWTSTHDFDLLDDVIDLGNLMPVLERAGRLVCVGDWRPLYGHFTIA